MMMPEEDQELSDQMHDQARDQADPKQSRPGMPSQTRCMRSTKTRWTQEKPDRACPVNRDLCQWQHWGCDKHMGLPKLIAQWRGKQRH